MSGIFPMVQPEAEQTAAERLPLCREVAWDYQAERPVYRRGRPVTVAGAEAVRVWSWRAIKTARFGYDVHTWDYGCEIGQLVGQPFTADVKESEAVRYVREALLTNPYITGVEQVNVSFSGTVLSIEAKIKTIYGEVTVNV